jgi:hypothetical protein
VICRSVVPTRQYTQPRNTGKGWLVFFAVDEEDSRNRRSRTARTGDSAAPLIGWRRCTRSQPGTCAISFHERVFLRCHPCACRSMATQQTRETAARPALPPPLHIVRAVDAWEVVRPFVRFFLRESVSTSQPSPHHAHLLSFSLLVRRCPPTGSVIPFQPP